MHCVKRNQLKETLAMELKLARETPDDEKLKHVAITNFLRHELYKPELVARWAVREPRLRRVAHESDDEADQ